MVRTDLIRGKMAECKMTQERLCDILNIDPKTFREHMKLGRFNTDEAYLMIQALHITNVTEVFFADEHS